MLYVACVDEDFGTTGKNIAKGAVIQITSTLRRNNLVGNSSFDRFIGVFYIYPQEYLENLQWIYTVGVYFQIYLRLTFS